MMKNIRKLTCSATGLLICLALVCSVVSQDIGSLAPPVSDSVSPPSLGEAADASKSAANQAVPAVEETAPSMTETVANQATDPTNAAVEVAKSAAEVSKAASEMTKASSEAAAVAEVKSEAVMVTAQEGASSDPIVTSAKLLLGCPCTKSKPTLQMTNYTFKSCILVKLAAHIETEEGEYVSFMNGTVNEAESQCEDGTKQPKLALKFECGSLVLSFNEDKNDSTTFVDGISGQYQIEGVTTPFSEAPTKLFEVKLGHSFTCDVDEDVKLGNQTLVLSSLTYEIFRNTSDTEYYQEQESCGLSLLVLISSVAGILALLGGIGKFAYTYFYEDEETESSPV